MPHDKAKLRRQAYDKIAKRRPFSGTGQGFGTGRGKQQGTRNKVPHKVREAIAAADQALRDPEAMHEVIRNLAAMGILDPDTFKQVMRNAPRFIPRNGTPQPELIRQQPAPTVEEIAMWAKLPLASVRRFKRDKHSTFFRDLRERYLMSRMTEGERRIVEALQHKNVLDAYQQVTGQQYKPRTRKRSERDQPPAPAQHPALNDPTIVETLRSIIAPAAPRIIKG